ncbi:hypothetical protein ABEB36_007469 [Hypothenemus hampei]|uniref:Uncharacterized protein n=1 Tax=Hypothenemus hampei TaxID=57062 RepID=A0ABD1EU35_HYPHA
MKLIISQPLSEEQDENLRVEGLKVKDTESLKTQPTQVIIKTEASQETVSDFLRDLQENSDTKKHYYLFKIKEFYDFLPIYAKNSDRYLRLEIIDQDDLGYPRGNNGDAEQESEKSVLVKRDITRHKEEELTDESLKDSINLLQNGFLKKRSSEDSFDRQLVRNDIGNFYPDSWDQDDLDNPENNNHRLVAYVPFFRVKKYYLHRKLLDVVSS